MSNFNIDIQKQNIRILMENNRITQQQLADAIDMSQSNISKALSLKDKKCFTVEQIYRIAEYFNVSIDYLLGYKNEKYGNISQRDIGKFLISLIKNKTISLTRVSVSEMVFKSDIEEEEEEELPWLREYKANNEYLAFYFSNYWDPKEIAVDKADYESLVQEALQIGNGSNNYKINEFIKNFLEIYKVYQKQQIDEEAYQVVVNNYLSRLFDDNT